MAVVHGWWRRFTLDGYVGELQGGVTYIKIVKQMLEQAENDWPSLLARLQRIRATILHKQRFLVNLTGDQVRYSNAVFLFVPCLPAAAVGVGAALVCCGGKCSYRLLTRYCVWCGFKWWRLRLGWRRWNIGGRIVEVAWLVFALCIEHRCCMHVRYGGEFC